MSSRQLELSPGEPLYFCNGTSVGLSTWPTLERVKQMMETDITVKYEVIILSLHSPPR